ncbi:MAG: hypothetical protein V9F01_01360 [Chitinophagaceae bacterium]
MNDIFIDAQVANKFATPPDKDYSDLSDWLWSNDLSDKLQNAHLVVCQKLINDYFGGNQHCAKSRSICSIYDKMMKEDRILKKTKDEISNFQKKFFKWKDLRCKESGSSDPSLIPLIFLSNRMIGLCEDENLIYDIINMPKWKNKAIVKRHPKDLKYR